MQDDDVDVELLGNDGAFKNNSTIKSKQPRLNTITALFAVLLSFLALLFAKDIFNGIFGRFLPKRDPHIIRLYSDTIVNHYIHWHNTTRTNIDRGLLNISDVPCVVWKGSHGIGDRFRGIMDVFIAAIISNRFLLIDWGKSIPINQFVALGKGTNFFYHHRYLGSVPHITGPRIRRPSVDNLDLFLSNASVIVSSDNSKPRLPVIASVIKNFPHLEYSRKVAKFWNGRLLNDIQFYHMLLSHLIRQTADFFYEKEMTKFNGLDSYGSGLSARLPSNYISVHVRYGEGVNEVHLPRFNFSSKGLNESSISACIAKEAVLLSTKEGLDPGAYFLATDTPKIRHLVASEIVKRDRNGTVFFGNWNTSHISSLKDETVQNYRALQQTFIELFLLSEGIGMVHLNSGFANLAKWIGNTEDSRVVSLNDCASKE